MCSKKLNAIKVDKKDRVVYALLLGGARWIEITATNL